MGLFGFGKKKEEKQNDVPMQSYSYAQYMKQADYGNVENEIKDQNGPTYLIGKTDEGKLFIEGKDLGNFKRYNKMGLIIDNANNDLNRFSSSQIVYNARVAYYNDYDVELLGKGDSLSISEDFENITLGFDFNLINDPKYLNCLMLQLLDRDRVEDCLKDTYSYDATRKYGDYVGLVGYSQNKDRYTKMSDVSVAQYRHSQFEQNRSQHEKIRREQIEIDRKRKEYYDKINQLNERDGMLRQIDNDSHDNK